MSSPRELRLGTRGSQLALYQARTVAARIAEIGGPPCRLVVIKTSGDRLAEGPLSEAGGKRLFVKEIEDALLTGDIDSAVHSSKDMPAVLPDGLSIGAVLPRENPLDALVLRSGRPDEGATTIGDAFKSVDRPPVIGTGSVRRIAQLTQVWPQARFVPIRGNLDTRLRKLDAGEYDALVLAAAGLLRLGFARRATLTLPVEACVPSPGQGVIAIESRTDDRDVTSAVRAVHDVPSGAALAAERALVLALGGDCQTPIGALASPAGADELDLIASVHSIDGRVSVRGRVRGSLGSAADLGTQLAAQLLADGAAEILAEVQRALGDKANARP